MIKNRALLLSVWFVILTLTVWALHALALHYLTAITSEVLSTEEPEGWVSWIYELYPRLSTEKWRFTESFFQLKSKQILIRFTLFVNLAIGLYLFRSLYIPALSQFYKKLISKTIDRKFIPYLTCMLYSCMLLIVYNAIIEFQALSYFRVFYHPVGIGKLLLPVFPSEELLWLIYIILLTSIASVVFLRKKWISATIAAIAFIYYQLILFGFGKYDHGFSTLTYCLLIFPFFLYDSSTFKRSAVPAWSLILIQWMICLSYFYCGLEKIFTSGVNWFYGDNLQQHLLIHATPLGLQLANYPTLCQYLSFGVLVMQLSFILIPFYKKIAYLLLPAGIIFHTATWVLLDAGGLFNPWWGVYLFFLFPLQAQETK